MEIIDVLEPHMYIGCAGWSIPAAAAGSFPAGASHLERYARHFNAVEINSSFYRPHRPVTYQRWALAVPSEFRFAVKVPRTITHERRLVGVTEQVDRFLEQIAPLGARLGPLLVQLPPSLPFTAGAADTFFSLLRTRVAGGIVCEPRHASWFTPAAEALLIAYTISRAAVDPPPVPGATGLSAGDKLCYYRLHGSPQMYYSPYDEDYLAALAGCLRAATTKETWCIFDNTASGAAILNALSLRERVHTPAPAP